MSQTLHLVQGLLEQARRLHESGQYIQAANLLTRLAAFAALPPQVAEEIQSLLADIDLRQGKYTRARRHLRAAIAHQPDNAEYHHRLGLVVDEDPHGSPRTALAEYRRCLKLAPRNASYWCDYAYAAINAGEITQGLAALRKASRLAPNDPEVLDLVVRGLASQGLADEARTLLRAALFRNARDYRFRALMQRFQFERLRERQQLIPSIKQPARRKPRTILPFVAASKPEVKLGTKTVRLDGPAILKGPNLRSRRRKDPANKDD